MHTTFARPWLIAVLLCCAVSCKASAFEAAEFQVFDNEPKLLIVHGYSTSQHWWAFLQRKLDRHAGGAYKRVLEVQLCNRGGTPIARWMDLDTGERTAAWKLLLTPMIQAERGKRPVVVLAQQSLQGVYPGDRSAGIRNAQDAERIALGAKSIERYAQLILQDGAEAVVVGMHIFKHSMEPEIGHERLALAELMRSKPERIYAGPDTWLPTSQHFPLAFDSDKLHPNFIGAEIMAHYWFDALLQREGLETPAWSEQEMQDAIQKRPLGIVRDAAVFNQKLDEWQIVVRRSRANDR